MMPKQQGTKTRLKDVSKSEITNDFGLMPRTFIMPPRNNLPAWAGWEAKKRLQISWLRLKNSVANFFTLFYFLKWDIKRHPLTGQKQTRPLRLRERRHVARELHRKLYTAIASRDLATLNKMACHGLLQKQKIRFDQRRGAGLPVEQWILQKYRGITYPDWLRWPLTSLLPNNSTQVVSDKIAVLPLGKDSLLRQCIVRLKTRQSLDKGDGSRPKSTDVTEYIVLQKLTFDGQEGDWMVWGTVQPSTMKEIDEMTAGDPGNADVPFMERMKANLSAFTNM